MIKLLIGGSSCTHWSIAQHNGREKQAKGIGWELFKCYLAAKEKFKPDFFLYENNKSASNEIKQQISESLGMPLHYINSSLVSAQNRQRFYVHNFGDIGQPHDMGITVNDILDDSHGQTYYELQHVSQQRAYCVAIRGRYRQDGRIGQHLEPRSDGKTNTITTVQKDNYIAQTIRIGDIQTTAQAHRVYSPYGKSVNLTANGGGQGAKTGLYMCPIDLSQYTLEKDKYHIVKEGEIETRYGKQRINLPDGSYIIRKLKPVECERLQTLPDGYTEGIPETQRYKCLGNGWTARVIEFILSHLPADKNEKIAVLSMFDGIATGRYVLEQLGYQNIEYYAYEIDKYAIQVATKNYPDIIQLGDAFDVLKDDWKIGNDYSCKYQPALLTGEGSAELVLPPQPAPTACNFRMFVSEDITPEDLKTAKEEGNIDEVVSPYDEIDIPLDTGGSVTVVCAYSDPNTARFVFKDCWDEAVMNDEATNKGGYYKSKGRAHVLVDILPHIAQEWRELMKPRKMVEEIDGERLEYADLMWLPSATDMFGTPENCWWNDLDDSFQLPIFQKERERVKECGDEGTYPYWLRSVNATNSYTFCYVYTDGSAYNYNCEQFAGLRAGL